MAYEIIPASQVPSTRRFFPKFNWPTEDMFIGHAFVIPLIDDCDSDGRSSAYIRQIAWKEGKRLGRRFAVNVVEGGLKVSRVS